MDYCYRNTICLMILVWCLLSVSFSGSICQANAADNTLTPEAQEALGRQVEQAGYLRQALTHYVSALSATPEGSADAQRLREKIIKTALKLDPPPAVPEGVERYVSRGFTAFKMAQTKDDYKNAVAEFQKALALAPWLPELYFDMGVVQEKAELYGDAIRSFNFYVLAAPEAKDRKDAQNKVYELEYTIEHNKSKMQAWVGTWITTSHMEIWNEYKGTRGKLTPSQSGRWFIRITDVSEMGDVKILVYKDPNSRDAEEVWTGVATPTRVHANKAPTEKKWMRNSINRHGPGELEMIRKNGTTSLRLSNEFAQCKRSTGALLWLWTYKYDGLVERTERR